MLPILMYPAFRGGKLTPWGGKKLKELFHKNIPDDTTGEALELSAIPGLPSRDGEGRSLPDLISQNGEALIGTAVGEPFPLLLKLLDAREQLSVQVHPDDEYAGKTENKLGKTEAWVILQAEPGARLVYGIRPGTTREELKSASLRGRDVEALLNYVPVHPGDVFYIPSGTVHAIGSGIVLYEIQQSSDVTYRFYDWDRTDEKGNRRELHLDKALDVTNLDFKPKAAAARLLHQSPSGKLERLLDEKYFVLDRYQDCLDMPLVPDRRRFSILTAIEEGSVSCGNRTFAMPAGQTALIPADCRILTLNGPHFLNAYPAVR